MENFEIADFMPLLIQSRSTKSLHLWLHNTMAELQDPEVPDVPDHNISEAMSTYGVRSHVWVVLKSQRWRQSLGIVGERERAWGSLPSVTKPNKACQSLIKASQFVGKRNKACQIFMPDRSKSWDILTKRVKWWHLSFPTLWVKLCWTLLRFVKLWYALGALINSWQSAPNF